jgi:ABC-type bacteriocin/lantibiotic exporter with double-glycine peptidase domain
VTKLRVAGAEERAFAYWGERFSEQQRLLRRLQRIEDSIKVFNAVLPTLASTVIFWFVVLEIQAASAAGQAGLTAGAFLAFNAAYGMFISGATSLSNTIIDLLEVSTLFERAQPILEGTPEVDDDKADPGRLTGKLALERVTFRYQEDGPVILDDVSIHAEPGEFIALVGPSGCGKSTTLRLLLGFDTPESGTVYYDDQDLAHLDIYAIRRQLGTVLQYSKLTSAPIYENIAGGNSITLDEAWEAARAAGLGDDINDMPMGMHTQISEGGTNLSGGQRQRLLIARALVSKPKIMLFDEATSALDNRTQAIVSASLEKMRATRVVIAHRLSTIRNADRIYVIDQGRVVQQGSFDELAIQDGLFAQLMARQTM